MSLFGVGLRTQALVSRTGVPGLRTPCFFAVEKFFSLVGNTGVCVVFYDVFLVLLILASTDEQEINMKLIRPMLRGVVRCSSCPQY